MQFFKLFGYKWLFSLFLLVCLAACNKQNQQLTTFRISTETDPQTLDPRRVRDLQTTTLIHMLYEGLTRNQENGQPALALAESVSISPDQKTYTFKLRQSAWSDGEPVTANDFEETWKSMLDPEFPCPNAYQLYIIRGAQAAKEQKGDINQVGVYAKDEQTLVVELEQPIPYFLHLTATHFFYPVHSRLRQQFSDVSFDSHSQLYTNGPFRLEHWHHHDELTAIPNPHYWDKKNVHLDRIALVVLDNPTALQLYQNGDLEWTGSPLSTLSTDCLDYLAQQGQLQNKSAAGLYFFRFNTEKAPFNHPKMRKAFALALNRQDLVEHVLQGNQIPAFGIVPPSFVQSDPFFEDHNLQKARQLFQEALEEQNFTLKDLPQINIYYATGERAHKIAQVAQQQWKESFGIEVALQSQERKVFFDQTHQHDYQLGFGSWFADVHDPISFLDVFKLKTNGTNDTQWENPEYIALLDESAKTCDRLKREKIMKAAEQILIEEMPVIPLFYASYNYVKNSSVNGVYFSELGYLDLKNASIVKGPK